MAQTTEEPLALPPSTVPTTSRLGLPPKLFVPLSSDAEVPGELQHLLAALL